MANKKNSILKEIDPDDSAVSKLLKYYFGKDAGKWAISDARKMKSFLLNNNEVAEGKAASGLKVIKLPKKELHEYDHYEDREKRIDAIAQVDSLIVVLGCASG